MITELKQLYEQNHTGDLRALKKAYEQHAEDCAQAAELTVDAGGYEAAVVRDAPGLAWSGFLAGRRVDGFEILS